MTKKDYKVIAGVIKEQMDHYHYGDFYTLSDLAQDLAVVFTSDNPRFDQDRFLEACGL